MRTFRRRLLLSCRVLAEKMFVGETSGRVLTLVLLRNWYVVQEIHLAPTPRMLRRLDADADKAMFLRCAVFGTVCLPIFALIDMEDHYSLLSSEFVRRMFPLTPVTLFGNTGRVSHVFFR